MKDNCMSYREVRIQTAKMIAAIIILLTSGIIAYSLGKNFEGVIVISFNDSVQFPQFTTTGYNTTDGTSQNITIDGSELSCNFSITSISTGIILPSYPFTDVQLMEGYLYRISDNYPINHMFTFGDYSIRTFAVNITSNDHLGDIIIKFKSRINCYIGFIDIRTEGNKNGLCFTQDFYFFSNSTDISKIDPIEKDFSITTINFNATNPYNPYQFNVDIFMNPLSTLIIDPTFR